jgi:Xaa-Pro aminopeptidase
MRTSAAKPAPAQPLPFPPQEFAVRRAAICRAIGSEAHALLQGAPAVRGYDLFRQTNEFHYCCGVEVPQAYLLISGADRTAALYLPHRPQGRNAEGESFYAEDAAAIRKATGVNAVHGLEALTEHVTKAKIIYTPHSPAEAFQCSRDTLYHGDRLATSDPWDGRLSREQHFLSLLRMRCPRADIRNLTPILDGLRLVKSPREIAMLREAGRLSALAVLEAMHVTRPGKYEFHLGALADALYQNHGARGHSYRPIIASGANIWFAHYYRNNCMLKAGELVLMDCAPDYGCYTSDIGRMIPIAGRYSPLQRELYGFMVEYHKTLLKLIRPGVTPDRILAQAAAKMAKVLRKWRFSKRVYRKAAKRTLTFRGHLSHPVGMAVHDPGNYFAGPLKPGIVFAVDPQMWIPEEKLYVRVEDTIVVTKTGIENFTAAAPLELDDVEHMMQGRRGPHLN